MLSEDSRRNPLRTSVVRGWYPAATSALEAFLLVALSSPLSTLMLVYTEVVQMRPAGGVVALKHLRHTVVSTITGLPVLAVFCSHLAHSSTGAAHPTLGLNAGSPRFIIFVTSALGMAAIFMVVHSGATRRELLCSVYRIGLLKRATAIFSSLVCVVVAGLFYINIPSLTYQYVFSVACVVLGVVLLVCLALGSETPLRIKDMLKMKEKQKAEGATEFSSESLDSPLRLFLRPDVTRGNESANPGLVTEMDEVMVTAAPSPPEDEGRELLPVRTRESSPQPPILQQQQTSSPAVLQATGTAETYVQPASDIERYESSPKKYQQDMPRPQPGRCFIEDSSGGVVVQACVEPAPIADSSWLPTCSVASGYVSMGKPCNDSGCGKRAIPVPPPCVPDLTYLPSLSKSRCESILVQNTSSIKTSSMILGCNNVPVYCNSTLCEESGCTKVKAGCSTPRVTFSGCDTVVEVDEPPPTPPPSVPPVVEVMLPSSSSKEAAAEARKQPEGREMPVTDDNVEGMLDRISHDLDYLLSRKSDTLPQPPLRSALVSSTTKKQGKADLKVKIKEPGNIIYINSPTHSFNGACDSSEK
ncbi:hypothetical protein B566_EDAN010558 [Ephemera danica]|nr:hypothetical protein B566_EDAN010558 [Ephemera danica]